MTVPSIPCFAADLRWQTAQVGLVAYVTPISHTCIRSIQQSLIGEVVNSTADIERLQDKVL